MIIDDAGGIAMPATAAGRLFRGRKSDQCRHPLQLMMVTCKNSKTRPLFARRFERKSKRARSLRFRGSTPENSRP